MEAHPPPLGIGIGNPVHAVPHRLPPLGFIPHGIAECADNLTVRRYPIPVIQGLILAAMVARHIPLALVSAGIFRLHRRYAPHRRRTAHHQFGIPETHRALLQRRQHGRPALVFIDLVGYHHLAGGAGSAAHRLAGADGDAAAIENESVLGQVLTIVGINFSPHLRHAQQHGVKFLLRKPLLYGLRRVDDEQLAGGLVYMPRHHDAVQQALAELRGHHQHHRPYHRVGYRPQHLALVRIQIERALPAAPDNLDHRLRPLHNLPGLGALIISVRKP